MSWLIAGRGAEPIEVGLFADLAVNLGGLPSGGTITVQVTARNNSGETAPTEINAVVS